MNGLPLADKFAPIPSDALAALATAPQDDAGSCVMPVPPDAPSKPTAHPKLGAPSYTWTYCDASGALLFEVWRFDTPDGKEIRPLSLWRGVSGLRWRWKAVPEPRTLYNLDKLSARPSASVIICEGEKSANAAAKVFPESVCVISPGGSQAASKADWTPLAGRKVRLWPDADEPGSKYALEVAAIVSGLGCEVSIIDAMTLASMAPDRGQREAVKGWDAADCVADWPDMAALRKSVHGLAKPFESVAFLSSVAGDDPLPLFPRLPEAEDFPMDALGPTLSRAAKAIASKAQVPPAMAAQSVLAAASLASCPHADVMLPFGQARPLAVYFMTVAASGDRKSTADNEALWPIHKREKALREEHDEAMKAWRVASSAWGAEKRLIEGNGKIDLAERRARIAALGEEPERPLAPFLVTGDLTIEGLTKNWPNLHGALGVFTAEGGMFTAGHGMNDDNRLKTAAMLSELWDGKPVRRLRALDGVTILPGRRLAMHVMIQPDAAGCFLANETLRDQGLLSRVLVAAPASMAGTRPYQEPHADDVAAIKAYGARLLSILEAEPALAPGKRNELTPPALPISAEAAKLWKAFHNHIEAQCGQGCELAPIKDFAAKAPEHAARIAGVTTIIEDISAREIGLAAMRNAVTLADWYVNEACRLQEAGLIDPRLRRAATLLGWLQSHPEGRAAFREILQFGPSPTRTKAAAEEALATLTSHGWIVEALARPRIIRAVRGPSQ